MTARAYYNEIDPFAAAWLRELIKAGHIALGDVDERDIRDVRPDDLRGYTQCHFFAGIGGWSHALRLAGFPDDRRVWTGSCPCQGFSTAGKRAGFSDPRHLWPEWHRLVRECRPAIVFGEQVEAAIGHGWWDLVQRDLEGEGYACGMAVLGAHSVGAPHRRQRCYFVADAQRPPAEPGRAAIEPREGNGTPGAGTSVESGRCCDTCGHPVEWHCDIIWKASGCQFYGCSCEWTGIVADPPDLRRVERRDSASTPLQRERSERSGEHARSGEVRELPGGLEGLCGDGGGELGDSANREEQRLREWGQRDGTRELSLGRSGAANFWSNAIWLPCRDNKLRPVEPSIFPVAHGIPNRVGQLRGAGNAIVPQVAQAFIEAYMETAQ